jgi:hypothetical protein
MYGQSLLWAWWYWMDVSGEERGVGAGRDIDESVIIPGDHNRSNNNRIDIFNEYRNPQSSLSLEERVMDLERMVYGEKRWSEPGLI